MVLKIINIFIMLTAICCWPAGYLLIYHVPFFKEKNDKESVIKDKISIIIPARNEEKNIAILLNSLTNQQIRPYEIIVSNDNSEDNTAETARNHGAVSLDIGPAPEGWIGKNWACHKGAEHAHGDILVFLDADTYFKTGGLSAALKKLSESQGILSIQPWHMIKKPYETFSLFFNLMQLIGMDYFCYGRKTDPSGMFGPCLIIKRTDYQTAGGHSSVKDKILENYYFADKLKEKGLKIKLISGRGALNTRMYPNGIKELIQGWLKSIAAGAEKTPAWIKMFTGLWITGLITGFFCLFPAYYGGPHFFLAGVFIYLIYVLQVYSHSRKAGNFPFWSSICYPVHLLFFLFVFFRAVHHKKTNRKVTWKNRQI